MTRLLAITLFMITSLCACYCGTVSEIYLVPGYVAVLAHNSQHFKVVGVDDQGNEVPVTEPVTWTVDSAAVGSITTDGVLTTGGTTSYFSAGVKATLASGVSAVANVDVRRENGLLWEKSLGGQAPGQLCCPSAIARDSHGNLIVADQENSRLQVFDANGRFVRQISSAGSDRGRISLPYGVAVDRNDNIYVADSYNMRVQKFSSTGECLAVWGGTYGSGPLQFKYPMGVAVDSNGNVFVADNDNNRVQKLDSSGHFLKAWGFHGPLGWPRAVAVDSQGCVYVVDDANNCVQKFTNDGDYLLTISGGGTPFVAFNWPDSVTTDSADRVYITEWTNCFIWCFDSNGTFLSCRDTGSYNESLAIDPDGNLYSVAASRQTVLKTSSTGVRLQEWPNVHRQGYLDVAGGVTAGTTGKVYVPQPESGRIQVFDRDGTFVREWTHIRPHGYDISPYEVTALPGGDIYVGCYRYTQDGIFVSDLYLSGYVGNVEHPSVGRDGSIYCFDSGNSRVIKFNSNGAYVRSWGSHGTQPGQFDTIVRVAAGNDGAVYVLDTNRRVQKFSGDGQLLARWTVGNGTGNEAPPHSVAVDPSGNVWVLEGGIYNLPAGYYLEEFDCDGNYILRLDIIPVVQSYWRYILSMSFDGDGNLYLLENIQGTLIKYTGPSLSVAAARQKPDGSAVYLTGQIVSAGNTDLYDCLYIESKDRSSGLRVVAEPEVYTGDKVTVMGTLTTDGGERVLQAANIMRSGTGDVAPLAMPSSAVGGGSHLGQPALWGWRWQSVGSGDPVLNWIQLTGLNTTGLLIKTWGRVVSVDSDWWTIKISEGSGSDGSSLKCVAPYDSALPNVGDFVTITGISSVEMDESGFPVPLVRTRRASDMSITGH